MAAKDYTLAVTGLTNTVWICKPSKKDKNTMTGDRAKVDRNHFIGIVLEWLEGEIADDKSVLEISVGGKVVAELKIDRIALGLKLELAYLQNEENHGKVIASGIIKDLRLHKDPVKWAAKIGDGYHDWAIYWHVAESSLETVCEVGNKITTESIIREMVPCSDEAFKMYRL